MNIANIKYNDIANGEGLRTSIFVSGCTHHCKGCFNSIAWDFKYGYPFDEMTKNKIFKSLESNYIKGISLLGGEPFEVENQNGLVSFLQEFKEKFPDKNVWCWSGYLFDELIDVNSKVHTENTNKMLSYIDILVDGEFKEELKDISLKFRGSSNQRIIDVKKSLEKGRIILYLE